MKTLLQTFKVSDVAIATDILPTISYHKAIEQVLQCQVEACYSKDIPLVAQVSSNVFLDCVIRAFNNHYPLVLSPDSIWLCLIQGLSIHINSQAEQFRQQLVYHQGKHTLEVCRDDFIKGSPHNNWSEVITQFSGQAQEFTKGDMYSLIVANFSTTGAAERTVSEIVLMDTLKEYFGYDLYSLCGIPEITLEGTISDWQLIRQNVEKFTQFNLDWWVKSLRPILDRLIETAKGNIDQKFWQSFYKDNDQSGGPYVTGWINVLFPYLYNLEFCSLYGEPEFKRNEYVISLQDNLNQSFGVSPSMIDFPSGLSRVPLNWKYRGLSLDMELIGGFMGISQNPETLAIRPEISWAIIEANQY